MKNQIQDQPQSEGSLPGAELSERLKAAVRGAHQRRAVVLDQAELEQVCGGLVETRTGGARIM